ncbi:ATP-binding protein [Candidatus Chlorohelix sp.]|uniref:sensor histidine kinase n=1 Tax=Candidatus Chlorohelix sp. TaxID=3139201 RepID=UPI00304C6D9C
MRLRSSLIISFSAVALLAVAIMGALLLPLVQGYQEDRTRADRENDIREAANQIENFRLRANQDAATNAFAPYICNTAKTKPCRQITPPTREEMDAAFQQMLGGKNIRVLMVETLTSQVLYDTEGNPSHNIIGQQLPLIRPRQVLPTPSSGNVIAPTPVPDILVGKQPYLRDDYISRQNEHFDLVYTRFEGAQVNLFGLLNIRGDARSVLIVALLPVLPVPNVLQDLGPILAMSGLVALLVSLIVGLFIARTISRPLAKATVATQAVARGDYSYFVPPAGSYEIRKMAESFNQMSKEIEQYQRMQRELIGNVSHELKTPLTAIRGFSQAMLDGALRRPEDFARSAEIINNETERMIRLVHSLLDLSRLESGQVKMAQEKLQLNEIIEQSLSTFEQRALLQEVKLARHLYPVSPLLGDYDRLRQVFNNLIDNALRYTPPGGSITVSCRTAGQNLVATVSDTGQGISPKDLPHIFERFYQAEKSRSKEHGGLGLGLAICKEIIHAHHGRIEVSSASGSGTTFTIVFPIASGFNDPTTKPIQFIAR